MNDNPYHSKRDSDHRSHVVSPPASRRRWTFRRRLWWMVAILCVLVIGFLITPEFIYYAGLFAVICAIEEAFAFGKLLLRKCSNCQRRMSMRLVDSESFLNTKQNEFAGSVLHKVAYGCKLCGHVAEEFHGSGDG